MKAQRNWFRPYRKGDLPRIWAKLREEDRREFATVGLVDPHLVESFIREGGKVMSWSTEGGVVAVLGVSDCDIPGVGVVWAVASVDALPRWRWAVRNTDAALSTLSVNKTLLTNYKDARNSQQINWLRRLGFTFFRIEEDYAGSGRPFLQFARIVNEPPSTLGPPGFGL